MSELKEFFDNHPNIEKVYKTQDGEYYLNAYNHDDGKLYAHKRFLIDPLNNIQADAEIVDIVTREDASKIESEDPAEQKAEQESQNAPAAEQTQISEPDPAEQKAEQESQNAPAAEQTQISEPDPAEQKAEQESQNPQ